MPVVFEKRGFMKKLLPLFILHAVFFLYTGCDTGSGGGSEDPVIYIPGNWTVMVWLDGDNNLETAAVNDFNEMELGLYNALQRNSEIEDSIKIIVQIDRISGYLNGGYDGGPDWQDTRRYKIKPDSVSNDAVIRSERLDDASPLGEIDMSDAGNLKDFISYCKTNYPSDNYALILWNHGGGVKGTERSNFIYSDYSNTPKAVCWDDTTGDDACIYIGEITDTLTDSEDVDFIGFDACLMGMAEIAYEYRPGNSGFNAEYMAGSPAEEQGDGWEYDALFSCFTGDSEDGVTAPSELLSKAVVNEYKRTFSHYSNESMSAYDLSKISDVKTELDYLAGLISSNKTVIESIRGNAPSTNVMEYFNQNYVDEWVAYPHFDLYDFASRVSSSGSLSTAARSAADALKTAVDACVLKSWGGSSYSGHTSGENGLGFFFTDGDYEDSSNGIDPFYSYQWWYTSRDTASSYGSVYKYGNLDFCNFDNDSNVETWKELLEYWYDSSGTFNNDTY